jgi:xanthine dehydrogenase small subunit
MRDYVVVYINGNRHELRGEQAFMTLSDFLRYERNLTGTKVVCSEGDCGACTVLVANIHRLEDGELDYEPVNSCISFMYVLDGCHIVTVEGLKEDDDSLNAVQESMVDNHGAQCGFCTPGFICAMNAGIESHLKKNNEINEKRVKNSLTGNLCRCTGYKSIIDSAMSVDLEKFEPLTKKYPSKEIIKDLQEVVSTDAILNYKERSFVLPTTFKKALELQSKNAAIVISGASDLGVLHNKRGHRPESLIGLHNVNELYEIKKEKDGAFIGARVNLHEIEDSLGSEFEEFAKMIQIFASPQIKNRATLIGNVANASPIGDSIPFLLVMNALVVIESVDGQREVDINEFYKGYKQLDLKDNELIKGIKVPYLKENEKLQLYKVSNRKDMDISIVTFAGKMTLADKKIDEISLAVGGVGPVVLRPKKTEASLLGKDFTKDIFDDAANVLKGEVTPIDDVRGSAKFRRILSKNLLLKFYAENSFSGMKGANS